MPPRTLYDKLWDSHLVKQRDDGSALIYIDRHLIHEVTSPQAFEGLSLAGRKPWRLDANLAVPDHNVSTDPEERKGGYARMKDEVSRIQLQTLDDELRTLRHPRDRAERSPPGHRARDRSRDRRRTAGHDGGLR